MAPLRCASIRDLFSAYIDGELGPQTRLLVQSHLAECPSCAKETESLRATAALIHDLPQPKPPDGFHATLVRRVKTEAATARVETAGVRRTGRGLGDFLASVGAGIRRSPLRSAAVVALALVVVVWAGGLAYYMGLPILDGRSLGLQTDQGRENLGFGGAGSPTPGAAPSPPGAGDWSAGSPSGAIGSKGAPESRGADLAAGGTGGTGTDSGGGATSVGPSGGTGGAVGALALGAGTGRQVILSVNLTVECEDVAKARDSAVAAAEGAGGFVESLNYWTNPDGVTSATMALRVPSTSLSSVLERIRPLGRVLGEQASRTDVTAQHIDLTARISNLRLQEQRLLTLLGKAENLGDIFALENELARIRIEIENYEGQLRSLDEQVSLSSIYLYLQPTGAGPGPGSGFWERLVDAFLKSLAWMGRLAAQLAIFVATVAAPVVLLGGLVWIVYRAIQARRRRAGV